MKFPPNFTLAELTRSSLALRHGVSNIPTGEEKTNLMLLATFILQPVRDHFGIPFTPSSGFRSAVVNRLAGSKPTSQHRSGQAADFEIPGIPNRILADWIKVNLNFDQLILEFHNPDIPNSGWIHASYIGAGNRNECLIFDGKSYTKF